MSSIAIMFFRIVGWPADMVANIVRHFEKRLFEFAMSMIMVAVGLLFLLGQVSVRDDGMHYLLLIMSFASWGVLFSVFGALRVVALAFNGHWMPGGAYARATCAAVGSVMWAQWAAALFQVHLDGNPMSPGIVVYAGLALFEVVSFYRALNGANYGRTTGVGHRGHQLVATYSMAEHLRFWGDDHRHLPDRQARDPK